MKSLLSPWQHNSDPALWHRKPRSWVRQPVGTPSAITHLPSLLLVCTCLGSSLLSFHTWDQSEFKWFLLRFYKLLVCDWAQPYLLLFASPAASLVLIWIGLLAFYPGCAAVKRWWSCCRLTARRFLVLISAGFSLSSSHHPKTSMLC